MARLVGVLVVGLVLASACARPGTTGGCTAQIDWVDFVKVGSTMYVAGPQPDTTLQEGDLGPVYAHVKFRVDKNVCDPNYRPKDGDAAFLDPGTPIYQVSGRSPAQLLAAHQDGRVVAFEALPPSP
jgi:hypothetical protein